jgi:hypothetical protein
MKRPTMALRKFRLRALAATVAVCALSMAGSALADTLADAIAKAYAPTHRSSPKGRR